MNVSSDISNERIYTVVFIEQKKLHTDLKIFLGIVITLITIGLLFVYSASSVYALEKYGSAHYFVKKQIIGLLLGIIGLIFFRYVPLFLIKKCSPLIFFGSLGITALTMVPALTQHINGSSRWLHLYGFGFQPSELLKITFIIYIAYFFSKRESYTSSLKRAYIQLLCILGCIALILLKQPDFGMTVTLLATAFIIFFIMHIQIKHLIATLSILFPLGALLIYIKPYRWNRILVFLNPWTDPQGAGFQIIQSLIAIGSGHWLGIGISHSKQKFFYLPMQHTDFIFSIIAEETGFIGSCLLIILYILFLYFGMRIAWKLKESFSRILTLGFIIEITLQTLINLAVTTGLVPTKGIGLPFVSYGNSALLCSLCMIGLIINCVHNNHSYQRL